MQLHLKHVKIIHEKDLADGFGSVYLPYALERKYPNANKDWREAGNMFFLPRPFQRPAHWNRAPPPPARVYRAKSRQRSRPPRKGQQTRHPPHIPTLFRYPSPPKWLRHAKRNRPGTPRPQRRKNYYDAKRTHVLNRGGLAVKSPLD